MITVQKLIDATPMYQSLSEKAQARFRKRLAKRLHKFFSKSGAVTDSLDDDFLSRFEVTADNAKKVTNLAGGIFFLFMAGASFWSLLGRIQACAGVCRPVLSGYDHHADDLVDQLECVRVLQRCGKDPAIDIGHYCCHVRARPCHQP